MFGRKPKPVLPVVYPLEQQIAFLAETEGGHWADCDDATNEVHRLLGKPRQPLTHKMRNKLNDISDLARDTNKRLGAWSTCAVGEASSFMTFTKTHKVTDLNPNLTALGYSESYNPFDLDDWLSQPVVEAYLDMREYDIVARQDIIRQGMRAYTASEYAIARQNEAEADDDDDDIDTDNP